LTLFPAMAGAALVLAPGCHSDLASVGQHCSLNSDCDSPLICVFTLCHEACKTSVDCPTGQRCVPSGIVPDDVCQLPVESTCAVSACNGGEVCGEDGQCRVRCTTSSQCVEGDTCATISKVRACYDPDNPVDQAVLVEQLFVSLGEGNADAATDAAQAEASAVDDTGSRLSDGAPLSDDSPAAQGESDSGVHDATVDARMADGSPVADGSIDAPTFAPNPDDGILGFNPSNFSLASVDAGLAGDAGPFANAPDVNLTYSGNYDCGTTADCGGYFAPSTRMTITQSGGNIADLFILNSLTLPDNASLSFSSANPVILAVLTAVNIQGTLYVNDGKAGGSSSAAPGRGAGQGGAGYASSSGYGSGSYCGMGGQGGTSTGPVPGGGSPYGTANLIPLVAGSNGGTSNGGGAGGGAIQIVAGQSITIGPGAHIDAGGQGGTTPTGSTVSCGGGSGGAILLEAPTVVVQGTLAANGGGGAGYVGIGADGNASDQPALGGVDTNSVDGGTAVGGIGSAGMTVNGGNGGPYDPGIYGGSSGGGGGGGAGWIRINAANASITGTVSPALDSGCASPATLSQ
jgi:hypothetical protein